MDALTKVYDFGFTDVLLFIVFFMTILILIRSRRPSSYPPGPTPIPLIGNFHNLAKKDFINSIRDLRKTYGDIFSLSLGSFWVIFVNGSDNLRDLLVKHGEYTKDRPPVFLITILGNKGVVRASGSVWKNQRTFALSKLREFGFGKKSFESNIKEELEMFLDLITSYKGTPFDIADIVHTSMSNIVMSIAVGRRFDYDDPSFKHIINLLNEAIRNPSFSGPMNFMPFLSKLPGDPFGGKIAKEKLEERCVFFRKEIEKHRETLDKENIRDFIDVYLIEMENQPIGSDIYTVEQLLIVISDLFGAGTETTATAIKWAILYMLDKKEIQVKMQEEIDSVVGSGRLPSMTDKPNLPYCNAVMLETLRLGNIVPFSLPHSVSQDITYKGMTIPKDSIILPILDSAVHDENVFPDSFRFKPERFLDNNGKICGQEKILAFSLGRRVCLGEALARMELFLYLTALVQRFEFLPTDGEDPPPIKGIVGIVHTPVSFKFRAVPRI